MHELSICQLLVDALAAEIGKLDCASVRLVKACVAVGAMRQVVPEFLEQAYAAITKDTVAEGSILEIRPVPVVGRCRDCGWSAEVSRDDFSCRDCGSGRIEIVTGMELYLDSMEVETDD